MLPAVARISVGNNSDLNKPSVGSMPITYRKLFQIFNDSILLFRQYWNDICTEGRDPSELDDGDWGIGMSILFVYVHMFFQ